MTFRQAVFGINNQNPEIAKIEDYRMKSQDIPNPDDFMRDYGNNPYVQMAQKNQQPKRNYSLMSGKAATKYINKHGGIITDKYDLDSNPNTKEWVYFTPQGTIGAVNGYGPRESKYQYQQDYVNEYPTSSMRQDTSYGEYMKATYPNRRAKSAFSMFKDKIISPVYNQFYEEFDNLQDKKINYMELTSAMYDVYVRLRVDKRLLDRAFKDSAEGRKIMNRKSTKRKMLEILEKEILTNLEVVQYEILEKMAKYHGMDQNTFLGAFKYPGSTSISILNEQDKVIGYVIQARDENGTLGEVHEVRQVTDDLGTTIKLDGINHIAEVFPGLGIADNGAGGPVYRLNQI